MVCVWVKVVGVGEGYEGRKRSEIKKEMYAYDGVKVEGSFNEYSNLIPRHVAAYMYQPVRV